MVFLIFTCAVLLAVVLLYFFPARWYWHALSVAAALALGVAPPEANPIPAGWGSMRDIATGSLFLFLLAWGLGAPLFHHHHHHHHERPHGAGA